jgi:hypothetical protein
MWSNRVNVNNLNFFKKKMTGRLILTASTYKPGMPKKIRNSFTVTDRCNMMIWAVSGPFSNLSQIWSGPFMIRSLNLLS